MSANILTLGLKHYLDLYLLHLRIFSKGSGVSEATFLW